MYSGRLQKIRRALDSIKQYRREYAGSEPGAQQKTVNIFFQKNFLFLTNSLTSGAFMGLGDMIHQEYEYQTKVQSERYDWARIRRMFIVGTFLGSLHHYYYLYLDKFLPKRSLKVVIQKIAADQFFCAPLTLVLFFYGMATLERKNLEQSTEELKNKFKYAYMGDWMFWPPIQGINFYYVPTQYRVFYINAATMIFDVFLSLMKHYDQRKK